MGFPIPIKWQTSSYWITTQVTAWIGPQLKGKLIHWVRELRCAWHWTGPSLVQVVAWCCTVTNADVLQNDLLKQTSMSFESKYKIVPFKSVLKCRLKNCGHFVKWPGVKSTRAATGQSGKLFNVVLWTGGKGRVIHKKTQLTSTGFFCFVLSYFKWACTKYHGVKYSRVPLYRGPIHRDIITALRWQYLTGELWCVYYEDFEENWPRYNGTALYMN